MGVKLSSHFIGSPVLFFLEVTGEQKQHFGHDSDSSTVVMHVYNMLTITVTFHFLCNVYKRSDAMLGRLQRTSTKCERLDEGS